MRSWLRLLKETMGTALTRAAEDLPTCTREVCSLALPSLLPLLCLTRLRRFCRFFRGLSRFRGRGIRDLAGTGVSHDCSSLTGYLREIAFSDHKEVQVLQVADLRTLWTIGSAEVLLDDTGTYRP